MQEKESSFVPQKTKISPCLTIFGSLNISFVIYKILFDITSALAKGPQYVVFLLLSGVFWLFITLISAAFWIKAKKGKKGLKTYGKAIFIVFLVLFSFTIVNGIKTKREFEYINVDGTTRQYRIYIPSNYDENKPIPLVLGLHGGSGSAKQFERSTNFDSMAEKYGFIMVYPDGVGLTKYTFHVWNSGYVGGDLATEDDVQFLLVLINTLLEKYSINESRIYMVGHSNGAMMSYRFAAEHPDIIAAIAPVSGTIGGKATLDSDLYVIPKPNISLSIVHVHGMKDINVLPEGGIPQGGFGAGERVDLSINDSINFWRDVDNFSIDPEIENSTNNKIVLMRYSEGINGTEFVLVEIKDQDHFWENMNQDVSSEQFYGGSMAEMIWNLIKNYNK